MFNFWQFNYNVSWCELFGFILFGILCASWIWISVCFPSLRKFSAIISLNKLFVAFFLHFLGLLWCVCWPTWFCPLSPLNCLHLFSLFFFFLFWLDKFHFPVFELANLFFFPVYSLMLNLSIEFFSSVIIFRFVISVPYLLMSSVSLLKFFLSLCIVLSSLSIFVTIILNCLSGKSLMTISFRSVSRVKSYF